MNKINIFRKPDEICKDLRSGNYLGQGTAYPNAIDWDIVNAWTTRLWKKLTGIDESFLMTSGTTGMLDLIFRGKIRVTCFRPAYDGFLKICAANGVEVNSFESVEDMTSDNTLCAIPDYIYLNTNFRNPDGYSMSDEEIYKVMDYARNNDITIVEDDPYFFLNNGKRLLSFLELYSKTIYLNSFSKALGSPGVRFGCFATRSDAIRKDIWGKMMTRFMYSNPFVIQDAADNTEIEKMDIFMDKIRGNIETRQNLLHFQGFYLWRKKDYAYYELILKGYKVKEGEAFGVPGYYRVSTAHVPTGSPEFAYLMRLYRI